MLIDSRIAIKLRRFIIVINDLSQLTSLGVDEKLVNPTISSSSSEVRLQIDSGKVIKLGKSAIVNTRKDVRQLIPAGSDISLEAHLAITRCSSDVSSQIHSAKLIKLGHAEMMSFCRAATC